MTSRGVAILAAVILLLGVIVTLGLMDEAGEGMPTADKLFPELQGQLASVSALSIRQGGNQVSLALGENEWLVSERGGYPADFDRVSELLRSLEDMALAERKTGKPENHVLLGVDDAEAARLELNLEANTLAVLVGVESTGRSGQFVRYPGQNQVWLTDAALNLDASPAAWLNQQILDIDAERIKEVMISAGENQIGAVRDVDQKMKLQGLKSGEMPKYDSVADSLARALSRVAMTDVTAREGVDIPDAATAVYILDNGLTLRTSAWQEGEEHHLAFQVQAPEGADETVLEEYETLRQLERWVFTVASYTYEDFVPEREDLVTTEENTSA